MDCKKVENTLPFKGFSVYNATSYVQEHTLINRGITTLGGSTVPQCIMSNNKYEARERALMGVIYLIASYLTPIMLIPLYNKHFLKNKGITKTINGLGKKIIQVPKRYLTPKADLKKGMEETAKYFDKNGGDEHQKAFEEIYTRYNNPDKLKKDLLSVHEKVLMTDFITTAAMWSAIPWIATEYTEHTTHRKDFSAGFKLKQDNNSEHKSDKISQQSKKSKLLWNVLFTVVPGILFSKTVTKGLSTEISKIKPTKNIIKKGYNKILKSIANKPDDFNYASGTNMSKTIYAAIWVLASFPAKLISSRDKNECKDRALRDIGLFTMFFGGDFLINNVFGRITDKLFGTKIMQPSDKKLNFFQKFKLGLRNFRTLDKAKDIPPEVLKKTKTAGASIYWFSLLANTALIGFALPKFLNKFLRYNIKQESKNSKNTQPDYTPKISISMNEFMSKKA